MFELTFVSGNERKVKEVRAILGPNFSVKWVKLDLPEFQGEPEDIAKEKCKLAVQQVKGPVITEDTSLCFNAFGGLPGPYIKWFQAKLGLDGLNTLLAGFSDKSAYSQCILAYCSDEASDPVLLVGRQSGKIVPPRGDPHFGWDPVFQPEKFDKTYAEMSDVEKNKCSHRAMALEALKRYLDSKINS